MDIGRSGKIYKLLNGDAKPSFDTITQILDAFPELSADWLLKGRGSMLLSGTGATDAMPVVQTPVPYRGGSNSPVITVTVDKNGDDNTVFVPLPAQAGYPSKFNEAIFLEQLIPYKIPGFDNGSFRAFEVSGNSMTPSYGHRDVVVCSLVDRWEVLKPWETYVIITSENVLLKRLPSVIKDRRGSIELHSDNSSAYPPYELPISELMQLWMVRGYVSTNPPSRPDRLMERLQEVIELLGHDYHEVRKFLDENAPVDAPSRK